MTFRTLQPLRRSPRRLAVSHMATAVLALMLGAGTALAAAAPDTVIETNSVLGTYLAARMAQDLRDTDAANALLKVALDRDPKNASLLEQAFISEVTGGSWSKAVSLAGRAVAADPQNHLAHLVLGVDAYKAGRLADAEKHFAEPGTTSVAVMARAWVEIARKDAKAASASMATVTEPNWVGFFKRFELALMADAAGDSSGAAQGLDTLFNADPAAINVALAYARHLSHSGDEKGAADVLAKHSAAVIQRHPLIEAAMDAVGRGETLPLEAATPADGLAGVFYGFAQALEGQGNVDLAMIYTQLALQLKPDDQLSLFSYANILEQLKKYDEAIDVYKRIPASSPLHFDASIREGLNLSALDKTDEAKSALLALADQGKAAPTTASTESPADLHKAVDAIAGVSPGERGDKVKALQALLVRAGLTDGGGDGQYGPATRQVVLQLQGEAGLPIDGVLNPATRKALEDRINGGGHAATGAPLSTDRLIDLYTTVGNMMRGQKKFADAADYYSRAIALIAKPEKANWDQFYSRAVCYERLNQWDKAEPDFVKAMDLQPDEPLILNYLGYSWVDRNENIPKALELIKKAVSLKPDDGYYVDSLGWAYFRMGKFDDAVQQLEHAVELKADDPTINDHLGDAYWRDGRKLEAQFQWSTALSSKPDAEDIPKIQDKLKNGLPPLPGAAAAATVTPAPAPTPAVPAAAPPAAPATASPQAPANGSTPDKPKQP